MGRLGSFCRNVFGSGRGGLGGWEHMRGSLGGALVSCEEDEGFGAHPKKCACFLLLCLAFFFWLVLPPSFAARSGCLRPPIWGRCKGDD